MSSNGGATTVGSVTATLAANTFTFTTEDKEDPALAGVTEASQSTWITTYFEGPDFDDQCNVSFVP